MPLVPTRECGPCTVCCTELTIDQPELQKLPGYTCPNCVVNGGCTIHATRPNICRLWFCGWRLLDWIGEPLRPDQSGVLVLLTLDEKPDGYNQDIALDVALLNQAGCQADGLAEMLLHAITTNIAVFLCLPGPPGQWGARMLINEELKDAAATGKPARVSRALRQLYVVLRITGQAQMRNPIVLGDAGSDQAAS